MALHIIAGTSDADQASEGDFLPKNDRYRRAGEYLGRDAEALGPATARSITRASLPHRGRLYRYQAVSAALPLPVLRWFSEGALDMGAKHCDVFAIFGEPLKETRDRIQDFRRRAAAFGAQRRLQLSLRPIMAETEGAAWDKANALLADVERKTGAAPQPTNTSPNACSATPPAATSMTSGCGWGLRAPPARPAIHHAWSERPNRLRRRCWSITGSAFIRSCCAVLRTRRILLRSAVTSFRLSSKGALAVDQQAEAAE
jgi:alkanesulfonate monooxygenase